MAETTQPALSESLEDYLEAIYNIITEHKVARASQVAQALDVGKSSVTGALNSLARQGLINYEPYQFVTLTPTGEEVAERIAKRHSALKSFLQKILSVPEDKAEEAACRLEHAVRGEIFERFLLFLDFVETCPRVGLEWIAHFGEYCRHGRSKKECQECLEECATKIRVEPDEALPDEEPTP